MVTNLDDAVDEGNRSSPLSELGAARVWGMLESAPDGMLMTDGSGVVLAVNRQVELMFGYDRADLLGREVEILLPGHLHAVHRAHRTRYRAAPKVRAMGEGFELRARRRDGTEFPVEVSLSPLTDDQGVAVVASIRDVTEKRRADARTRRIQAAIDAVHDGVFMFEPDTLRFVYANEGASLQVGYSNDELLAMTPLHIEPEFSREEFDTLIAPLVDGTVDHLSFRTIHRHKSGRDVPVDIMLEHRRGTGDDIEGVATDSTVDAHADSLLVAIVRDVTEQVEVERRLVLSEQTFRTSFDNAPVGMTIARFGDDGERGYERVNVAFARMLGRTVDSLIGVDSLDISHPDNQAWTTDAIAEMSAGRRDAVITEKRYLRDDGTYVWTLVHEAVIERADGMRTLSHVVDITDRRERQAERERLATMDDRERIARDLHDLVIQRLFGAGMRLQAVIPEMASQVAIERTHETIGELDATIRELRSAIFSLHRRADDRSVTEEITLAIEQHVDRLGFRPAVSFEGPVDSLAEGRANELRATLREALSNVARHARATKVEVRVVATASTTTLVVTDDGCGIPVDGPRGDGLANMAERATRLGGEFSLLEPESGGCELLWSIPR
ncbi:MAG: PAS domain S-box protein [Ilumatobacter sp.]